MSYKSELINEIISVGKMLHMKNYSPGYSGNISVRLNKHVLITVSGSANGFLTNDDFVEIDFDSHLYDAGKKPSSENKLHLEFYRKRADVNAIIHVHSAGLGSFAAAGKDLMQPVMIENVCYFKGIPLANYALPSSKNLVKETSKYFSDYNVVLMKNHGVIIGGTTIKDAYLKLEMAEEYSKSIIYAKNIGGVDSLTSDDVNELHKLMGY
jgi:L-fuculose-phosphate aldolase